MPILSIGPVRMTRKFSASSAVSIIACQKLLPFCLLMNFVNRYAARRFIGRSLFETTTASVSILNVSIFASALVAVSNRGKAFCILSFNTTTLFCCVYYLKYSPRMPLPRCSHVGSGISFLVLLITDFSNHGLDESSSILPETKFNFLGFNPHKAPRHF